MANKTTQKEYFEILKSILSKDTIDFSDCPTSQDELLEFIDGRLKQLEKKKTSSKSTEKAEQNQSLMEELFQALENEVDPVTVSELINHNPNILFDGQRISNQKASFLLNKLVKDGRVEKGKRKSLSIFMVPLTEEPTEEKVEE